MLKLHVYTYENWTNFEGMKSLKVTPDESTSVQAIFKAAGWDGVGVLHKYAVPPIFLEPGKSEPTMIFHLKQEPAGTSFIGLPVELPGFSTEEEKSSLSYHGSFRHGIMTVAD